MTVMPYEHDDEPRLVQDIRTAEILAGPDITAREEGVRLHPNGVVEVFRRVEY